MEYSGGGLPPPFNPGDPFQCATNVYSQPAQDNVDYVPNALLKIRRKVNLISFIIIYVSAPIVLITYAVILMTEISPTLDLIETGNWWCFLNLFLSCALVLVGGAPPLRLHFQNAKLTYKHVVWFNVLLLLGWVIVIFCGIGASETFQDRSRCNEPDAHCSKHHAPRSPTAFGIYIDGVCYNGTLSANSTTPIRKDPVKCEASRQLKVIIYSMYAWVIDMMLVQLVDAIFGLGNYRAINEPEMIAVYRKKEYPEQGWSSQNGFGERYM